MACIDCETNCGKATGSVIRPEVAQVVSLLVFFQTILGAAGTLIGFRDTKPQIIIVVVLLAAAFLLSLIIILLIAITAYDKCSEEPIVITDNGPEQVRGVPECVAGVVHAVASDFSNALSWAWFFPWTANHDRIDVIVTSKFWTVVESHNADVFCTDEFPPRRSEYIRCYFYTDRICNIARAALIGAILAFIAAAVIAAIVIGAVAIAALAAAGCALTAVETWGVGCWVIFAVAVIAFAGVVAAATLIGATAAGLVVAATSEPTSPTDAEGKTITVGDLVTLKGNLLMKEESAERFYNLKVNVFWWVDSNLSLAIGRAPDSIPNNPFSYCEINDCFYVRDSNDEGKLKSFDGCSMFADVVPTRCR